MPINKFTTLLDLARQAKILTGETATFDGKIQAGIPFSGYPTGVDTGSTVSLGIVSSEDAVFSGNTGTTIFDVSNPLSPNYDAIFSGYTATTWTNPIFSANTSGLTLPITPFSADTQIVGPFWTLTQTGMTGDYVIGTQYTGYSVTYSFNQISNVGTGGTEYSGFTTATQENFSAGTLDYKGPLDYISSVEDATIDGRLTTNKITITNGASSATTNYILAQTDDTGNGEWNSLSSLLSGACHPLINLEVISGCSVSGLTIESDVTVNGNVVINGSATTINTEIIQSKDNNIVLNYSGTHLTAIGGGITLEDGVSNGVDSRIYTDSDGTWLFYPGLSATSGTILNFTADTISVNSIGDSGDCVNDLYVSNIHSCSPLNINPLDEGNVYFGSTSGVTVDVLNGRIGIGTEPSYPFHIKTGNTQFYYNPTDVGGQVLLSGQTGLPRFDVGIPPYLSNPLAGGSIGLRTWDDATYTGYGKVGDMFIRASDDANGLNIINGPGAEDYIRFYAGINATSTSDIHIQGSGSTRGFVGIGTETPIQKLHIENGDILIQNSNAHFQTDFSSINIPEVLLSGTSNGLIRHQIFDDAGTGVQIGIRAASEPSFPGFGSQGDGFIYAGSSTNGLNIINNLGVSKEDYIRFYAGKSATSTADVHIQGSGSTKGYVGIGTETPTEKLVVDGNVKIIGNSGSVIRSLTIGDDDEITFQTQGTSVADNIRILSQPTTGKILLKNGTINDRYTEFGQFSNYGALVSNFGSPTGALFIQNAAEEDTTIFRVGSGASLSDVFYIMGDKTTDKSISPFSGVSNSKIVHAIEYLSVGFNASFGAVGSTAFAQDIRIDANGVLTTNTSDERLKENINSLSGSLETILQLSGVSYNWKDRNSGGDDTRYGFIAQRVDEVDSNLTTTNKVDGFMGLKSDCFTPLIVESIKELYNNPSIPNYTPSSSGDTYGSVGNVTIDDDYLYVKTNNGWKRTTLESF